MTLPAHPHAGDNVPAALATESTELCQLPTSAGVGSPLASTEQNAAAPCEGEPTRKPTLGSSAPPNAGSAAPVPRDTVSGRAASGDTAGPSDSNAAPVLDSETPPSKQSEQQAQGIGHEKGGLAQAQGTEEKQHSDEPAQAHATEEQQNGEDPAQAQSTDNQRHGDESTQAQGTEEQQDGDELAHSQSTAGQQEAERRHKQREADDQAGEYLSKLVEKLSEEHKAWASACNAEVCFYKKPCGCSIAATHVSRPLRRCLRLSVIPCTPQH